MYGLFAVLIIALLPVSVFAQNLDEAAQEQLVRRIADTMRADLTEAGMTWREKRRRINRILDEQVGAYIDALGFDQPWFPDTLLFKQTGYFTPAGFMLSSGINPDRMPPENWLAAYMYVAVKAEIDFRNNLTAEYDLATDPELLAKLRETLPLTASYNWPHVLDESGALAYVYSSCIPENERTVICRGRISTEFGDSSHPQHPLLLREIQKLNRIASPLFLWLLQQPNGSVSSLGLFNQALKIYGDAWVSAGVITWLMKVDAHAGHRRRGGVIGKRLVPLITGSDQPGYNYHFWGFFLKGVLGYKTRYWLLSWGAESVVQDDPEDRLADTLGLDLGDRVRARVRAD